MHIKTAPSLNHSLLSIFTSHFEPKNPNSTHATWYKPCLVLASFRSSITFCFSRSLVAVSGFGAMGTSHIRQGVSFSVALRIQGNGKNCYRHPDASGAVQHLISAQARIHQPACMAGRTLCWSRMRFCSLRICQLGLKAVAPSLMAWKILHSKVLALGIESLKGMPRDK